VKFVVVGCWGKVLSNNNNNNQQSLKKLPYAVGVLRISGMSRETDRHELLRDSVLWLFFPFGFNR